MDTAIYLVGSRPMSGTANVDPSSLLFSGSIPIVVLVWLLIAAAAFVWLAIVIKTRQVRRWRRAEVHFERQVSESTDWKAMEKRAKADTDSLGAPVLAAMFRAAHYPDVLEAVGQREIERQHTRVHGLMTGLSSIGAVAPLAGLFGTVYGIIHAFLRIGAAKSASLSEVAPAIGEALITTAVGLFAAIPAVVAYNILSKQLEDLLAGVDSASRVWAGRIRASVSNSIPDEDA